MAMIQPTTTDFSQAFNTMTLADPAAADWYMDSGATSHLESTAGILNSSFRSNTNQTVVVGNGSKIHVLSTGSSFISSQTRPLALNRVLITPHN